MGAVRPEDGGGIGPLDLIQLLLNAPAFPAMGSIHVVEEQLSTAVSCNAAAVLDLPPREVIVATFVCRKTNHSRWPSVCTASRVGFSSCGVGPDHPHDMYISFAVDIDQIVRAFKGDAEYGSAPSLNLVLVEGRALQFECLLEGHERETRVGEFARYGCCQSSTGALLGQRCRIITVHSQ